MSYFNLSVDELVRDSAKVAAQHLEAGAMQRQILTYGGIAGFVIIVTMIIGIELGHGQEWLGYLIMLVAFSTIFVAVKQYRDHTLGGVIRFVPAFLMGLGIAFTAGVVYVAIWELYTAMSGNDWMRAYADGMIEAKRTAGASAAEIAAVTAEAERLFSQYSNPLFRLPLTFLEVFPIGFLVSLGSAAILRNQRSVA